MKRALLLSACLAFALSLPAVVADLDGVRGIQWGAGPAKVKSVFAQTGAQIKESDQLIEAVPQSGPVSKEKYFFLKGQLFKVSMTYNMAPAAVLDYFTNQYGKPEFEKNAFWWKFPSTLAKIEKGTSTIWYRSRDIKEEVKSETEEEEEPDQPEDLHENISRVSVGMTVAQVTQLMGEPLTKRAGKKVAFMVFTYRTGEIAFVNNKVAEVKIYQKKDELAPGKVKRVLPKRESDR